MSKSTGREQLEVGNSESCSATKDSSEDHLRDTLLDCLKVLDEKCQVLLGRLDQLVGLCPGWTHGRYVHIIRISLLLKSAVKEILRTTRDNILVLQLTGTGEDLDAELHCEAACTAIQADAFKKIIANLHAGFLDLIGREGQYDRFAPALFDTLLEPPATNYLKNNTDNKEAAEDFHKRPLLLQRSIFHNLKDIVSPSDPEETALRPQSVQERDDLRCLIADVSALTYFFGNIHSAIVTFNDVCIPELEKSRQAKSFSPTTMMTIAAFFASVTVTALQLHYSVAETGTATHKVVGIAWFGALALSVAGVLNGLVSAFWIQTGLPMNDFSNLLGFLLGFGHTVALAFSAVFFSVGICVFAYSSTNTIVAQFTTAFTAITFITLYCLMAKYHYSVIPHDRLGRRARMAFTFFWLPWWLFLPVIQLLLTATRFFHSLFPRKKNIVPANPILHT